MSSPFQKGFIKKSPIDKKLVGKQNRLPEELKAKILAAPEDSPVKKEKDPREKVKDTIRITKPTHFKLKENDYIDEDDFENQFDQVEGDPSTFPQFSVQDYSKLKKDKKGFYVTKLKEGEYND
jgi:hypothetical protein